MIHETFFSDLYFFFFNDTATTEIYTLSLHDALPICLGPRRHDRGRALHGGLGLPRREERAGGVRARDRDGERSEEHTSELQSQSNLVCRLLLEKKKKIKYKHRQDCDEINRWIIDIL